MDKSEGGGGEGVKHHALVVCLTHVFTRTLIPSDIADTGQEVNRSIGHDCSRRVNT